ncbi:avirulence protein 1b [Phytophthora sojae]|uniref:RxLR effector protein n=1 Tax=Phytophthora sojae (strain P6497) TaxID=1094619 RepID=G4Z5H7_PHYSP|nr:avirulence protein 1b [Phytophthora sojae]EGZ21655.1 avirulence protein 1b [Phytophthora sojae]|eukprot:XP_009524372.1 avirulence protein 1b [Phytophthora sojae]
MHSVCVAFVLIVTILATCHGLPSAEAAVKTTGQMSNTDPKLPSGGVPARFLRGGHDDDKDEERAISSKIASIFKKKPSILTTLQRHPTIKNADTNAIVKSLERNPTIKSLANNPSKKIKLTQENIKKVDTVLTTSGIANEIKTNGMLLIMMLSSMSVMGLTVYGLMAIVLG